MRNKSVMRAKFVQKMFMALFLGFLYFQTKPDQVLSLLLNTSAIEGEPFQDGVTNLKGVLFFFCSELTYPTVYGIQTYMPSEFPLLVREYHNGDYPVLAYYVAKVSRPLKCSVWRTPNWRGLRVTKTLSSYFAVKRNGAHQFFPIHRSPFSASVRSLPDDSDLGALLHADILC